mmetsp:Transcript_31272/g.99718  ORF Transcript_31272/g.99718 Transcript_31272/m.99718 type:complete len:346 (+) Transcript_31272:69-1106(+)
MVAGVRLGLTALVFLVASRQHAAATDSPSTTTAEASTAVTTATSSGFLAPSTITTTTTVEPAPATMTTTAEPTTSPSTITVPPVTETTTTTKFDPYATVKGTWTTGYWDCCKPSCSWPGKGKVKKPVMACDVETGEILYDANEPSICQGGRAATCKNSKPFNVSEGLSMGFAAAAVSGGHGLVGDANCGQCFELKFIEKEHPEGQWGGAGPALVGKRMVVQVTNIGYDVTGDHSFDIMIPGAGQGAFSNGCSAQFQGFSTGDFDCDTRFGGCTERSGCDRLPAELQDACRWRYDWYHWLENNGKTNNPYVDFRRVRCPTQLTELSGSVAEDDELFPKVEGAELRL